PVPQQCRDVSIPVRDFMLDSQEGLPIGFGVWVDEVVQGITLLPGCEHQVSPFRKLDAILVMRAEKVLPFGRILSGFRGVHGNPTDSLGIKLSPAMVSVDLSRSTISREWKANRESSGYPHRPG